MPTRIFLLRHAETSQPHIFHGAESDIGLSDRGVRQAAAVASLLAAERPRAVVSSAMRRAVDTALPIARACGVAHHLEPDLHERRVGALTGMPFRDNEVWPDTVARWSRGETGYAPPGAESFDDIRNRVLPVWQRLAETFAGQTLVIVAHGIVCKVLLLSIVPNHSVNDWQRLGPIHNVGVSELVRDNQWSLVRFNQLPEVRGIQEEW